MVGAWFAEIFDAGGAEIVFPAENEYVRLLGVRGDGLDDVCDDGLEIVCDDEFVTLCDRACILEDGVVDVRDGSTGETGSPARKQLKQ